MKVYPNAEDDHHLMRPAPRPPANASFFSCFTDAGCLEATTEELACEKPTSGAYTALDSSLDSDTLYLQTRKPVWNREIKHWVHNFGGRVRIPSNKNFLVVQSTAAEHYNALQFSQGAAPAHGPVPSAADAQVTDRVCIRHGQVNAIHCVRAVLAQLSVITTCWLPY